jgi:dTDP-glucose 4,6-dehydratase
LQSVLTGYARIASIYEPVLPRVLRRCPARLAMSDVTASSDAPPTWLVTGGAGFIGSNYVRHLLRDTQCNVVVVDALTYSGHRTSLADVETDSHFEFVHADICDAEAMASVLTRCLPSVLVNFAAETHVDRSIDDPWPFVRTNVNGTCTLLEATRRHNQQHSDRAPCRFVHISTDEVYGSLGNTGLFRESTAYAPNSPYSASKASADHFVRAYFETYAVPTVITNCSNNYGPYQFPEKLIPLMVLNALEARDLPIYGDGSHVRDWLYVDDHCVGITLAASRGESGERYNIGGNNEFSNLELVDLLCAELEVHVPASINTAMRERGLESYSQLKRFVKDRPGHDQRYAIDSTRIRTELGWTPKFDLRGGLARTVHWYLHNQGWCEAVTSRSYDRERLGLSG